MSLFAITFRVDYDATYQSRYDSLVDAIKSQTTTTYWVETTSFFLMTSDLTSTGLADAVVGASKFDAKKDLLVIINLSVTKGHCLRGKYTDKDFDKLMASRAS